MKRTGKKWLALWMAILVLANVFAGSITAKAEVTKTHTHTEDCYTLVCGLEESEEHTHTEGCYALTCGYEENDDSQDKTEADDAGANDGEPDSNDETGNPDKPESSDVPGNTSQPGQSNVPEGSSSADSDDALNNTDGSDSTNEPGSDEAPGSEVDLSALQARIDALPTVAEYQELGEDEAAAVCAEVQAIADIYEEELTEEQQANIQAERLMALLQLLSSAIMPMEIPQDAVAVIEGSDTGYETLQEAISASADGDTIYLCQDVAETITSSQKKYTLDLQGHKIAPAGGQVYYIWGGDVTLKNGTLTGGNAKYGGIRVYNADFHGENLTVTGNTSTSGYGAVFIQKSNAWLTDCVVKDNVSAYYGSGICLYDGSSLTASGVTVSGNTFYGSYTKFWLGGGIYAAAGNDSVTLEDGCSISGNSAYYGGGIYAQGPVTVTDSSISNNTASDYYGGGIYSSGGNITIENSGITGNSSGYYGGGVYSDGDDITIKNSEITGNSSGYYGGGMYSSGGDVTIHNCQITNNESRNGGGLDIAAGNISITDTVFTGNKSQNSGAAAEIACGEAEKKVFLDGISCSGNVSSRGNILVLGAADRSDGSSSIHVANSAFTGNEGREIIYINGEGDALIENSRVENNTGTEHIMYILARGNIEFASCRITGNSAAYAGGMYSDTSGTIILTDSVIKENAATAADAEATGGIYVYRGSVRMTGGAVYNNRTAGSGNAKDWYIAANRNVSAPAAAAMTDGDFSFEGYVWQDTVNGTKNTEALTQSTGAQYLVAIFGVERDIAKIGETIYHELADAVDQAKENDTILLIAGENDEYGQGISTDAVTIDKNLTIDVNGRTVNAAGETAFAVTGGALVTLAGSGAVNGTVSIEDGSSLSVDGSLQMGEIYHNGASLAMNAWMDKPHISLGEGRWITFGGDFDCESLEISLASDVLDGLNADEPSQEMEVVIAQNAPAGLADKITIAGLTNKLVSLQEKDGMLILRREKAEGIYIDGKNGNDSNPGSYQQPVRTFEKAKELLDSQNGDTIYVVGQISLSDGETWDLGGKTLARYPNYDGCLVSLSSTSSLTLKNIVIDDARQNGVDTARSMIITASGSELVLEDGAVLQNNDVSGNTSISRCSGGAIYSEGTLAMNGGIIQNCSAVNGGGIYCYKGVFTLNEGSIVHNENYTSLGSKSPSGGGVLIDCNAQMIMNGGTISGNKAAYGGGIALGGNYFIPKTSSGETLIMNGGTITGNASGTNGGGIYVQGTFTATINAGTITNNSGGSGNFGGGGIYVNGGGEDPNTGIVYANGRLQLYNALIANNATTYNSGNKSGGGGGIAGCSTSNTRQYIVNGGVIYNNTAGGQKDDILISNSNGANVIFSTKAPESYISEFMLGGGAYFWKWVDTGTEVGVNSLHSDGVKEIYTDRTDADACIRKAKAAAKVIITGNTATRRGGGIGSNGDVFIGGTLTDTIDIPVTKVWDDNDDAGATRPDNIKIWLLRNGEKVSCLEFRINYYDASQGGFVTEWPETLVFTDQPRTDANGDPYVYTVEEDVQGLGNRYVSTAEKISDTAWKVTNTLVTTGSLSVSKTVSGSGSTTQAFTFTVTLDDDTVTGKFGDMTFEKGTAVFTLWDGQSVTAEGLPEGTGYTVRESDNSGYTVTVNNTKETTATGTIAAGQTAKAAFNNDRAAVEPAPAPAKVTLTAIKTLDGAVPEGSDFTFVLKNADKETLQTRKNDGGGIVFDTLFFSETGVFTYYIAEEAGNEDKIIYDTSVYKVVITVTKSGDYKASVVCEKDGQAYADTPVFANTTRSDPGDTENPGNPGDTEDPGNPGETQNPVDTEDPGSPGGTDQPGETDKTDDADKTDVSDLENGGVTTVETGDSTHMFFWIAFMAVSCIGLWVSVSSSRRRRQ